ncbi:MAG: gamma-glutamyl-gamma-aminobutyrate hydrolase family protein [Pseudomonadota bacterium]
MSKPLIAVTSDYKHVDPYMWHAVPSPYIDAATDVAGVIPLALPSLGDRLDLDALLDRVEGVLVTGSRSNVHPSHYDTQPTQDHEPFDPDRDATTLPLIRRAIERGVPLLAICRGIQELNVALGGSITAAFQKNRRIEGHGYPWEGTLDERFAMAHGLKIKSGSCLESILGDAVADASVPVNSLHTQALDRLGDRIEVEAVAEDGTVEAVTVKDAPGFVIGVQWHPEYWASSDTASNRILSAFGDAARAHLAAKTGIAVAAE